MNPALLRAYQYLVALVAVHMVVLGVANVLRVLAEIALGAPSGGFTGLPFLFAEGRNQPLDLHREQLSLALALLLVGGIAWWLHWGAAQRSGDRASAWRAFYVQLVLFVTALLVVGYGARTLSLLLRAGLIETLPPDTLRLGGPFDPDRDWPPRAAGAFAMVVAAAGAWWYHARVAERDRPSVGPIGRAATIRRIATYLLVGIGVLLVLLPTAGLLQNVWTALAGPPEPRAVPPFPPGAPPRITEKLDVARQIRFAVVSDVPPALAGLALAIVHRLRARAIARAATPEGAAERGSVVRQVLLGLALLIVGPVALGNAAGALAMVLERLSGDPAFGSLVHRLASPVPFALVFAAGWAFLWWTWWREPGRLEARPAGVRRLYLYVVLAITASVWLFNAGRLVQRAVARVVDSAAATPAEILVPIPFVALFALAWWYHRRFASAAPGIAEDARRLYQYAFLAVSLAAAAVGAAGTIGVAGSYALGQQTHPPREIGLYVALLVVGLAAWALQWRSVQRSATDDDRRSRPRRLELSLAVLGGVVALLAFGAGALFRVINAVLALSFTASAAHDLWHLLADSAVGAVVAWYHWRALREDRATSPASDEPAPLPLVVVLPAPAHGMRRRLAERFAREGGRVFETDAAGIADVTRRLEGSP